MQPNRGIRVDDLVLVSTVLDKQRNRFLNTKIAEQVDEALLAHPKGCAALVGLPLLNRQHTNQDEGVDEELSASTSSSVPKKRLYKQSHGTGTMLSYMSQTSMKNSSGHTCMASRPRRGSCPKLHRLCNELSPIPRFNRSPTLGTGELFGGPEHVADLQQASVTHSCAESAISSSHILIS